METAAAREISKDTFFFFFFSKDTFDVYKNLRSRLQRYYCKNYRGTMTKKTIIVKKKKAVSTFGDTFYEPCSGLTTLCTFSHLILITIS